MKARLRPPSDPRPDYVTTPDPGHLRVSADHLRERLYVPDDRFVEREQEVHRFAGGFIVTDSNGDTWRLAAIEGGGIEVIAHPKRYGNLVVMPVVGNVLRLRSIPRA